MSSPKRQHEDQDPENEGHSSHKNKQPKTDDNEELKAKVLDIIRTGFSEEEKRLEARAFDIHNRISYVQDLLSEVRLSVVTNLYGRPECMVQQPTPVEGQTRIHPAVKKLLGIRGRQQNTKGPIITPGSSASPASVESVPSSTAEVPPTAKDSTKKPREKSTATFATPPTKRKSLASSSTNVALSKVSCVRSSAAEVPPKAKESTEKPMEKPIATFATPLTKSKPLASSSTSVALSKVPCYVPPKPKEDDETSNTPRGVSGASTVLRRLIVGNVSRWLPADTREDKATHKWMMYIRIKDVPDPSRYITKVRYLLDPSYRPNDLVEVTSPPFYLTRRGWGEFPIRVQVHFAHPADRPLDVRHTLKLDTTYTGQDSLGSETLVDVYLHTNSGTSVNAVERNEGAVEPNKEVASAIYVDNPDNGVASENTSQAKNTSVGPNDSLVCVKKERDDSEPDTISSFQPPFSKKIKTEVKDVDESESVVATPSLDYDLSLVKQEPLLPVPGVSNDCSEAPGSDIFYGDLDSFTDSFPIKEEVVETTDEIDDVRANNVTGNVDDVHANKVTGNVGDRPAASCPPLTLAVSCPPLTKPVTAKAGGANVATALVQSIQAKTPATDKTKMVLVKRPTPFKPLQAKTPVAGQAVVMKASDTSVASTKNSPNTQDTVLVKCLHQNGKTVFMTLKRDVANALLSSKGLKGLTKSNAPQQQQNPATPVVKSSPSNSTSLLKSAQTPKPSGVNGTIVKSSPVPGLSKLSHATNSVVTKPKQTVNVPVLLIKAPDKTIRLPSNKVKSVASLVTAKPQIPLVEGTSQLPKASLLDVKNRPCGPEGRQVVRTVPIAGTPTKTKPSPLGTSAVPSPSKTGVSLLRPNLLPVPPPLVRMLSRSDIKPTPVPMSGRSDAKPTLVPMSGRSDAKPTLVPMSGRSDAKPTLVPMSGRSDAKPTKGTDAHGNTKWKSEEDRLLYSGRALVVKKTPLGRPCNTVQCRDPNTLRWQGIVSKAIARPRFDDMVHAVRWFVRHFPVVHPSADETSFKAVYPYAAASADVFLHWPHGKQRATEWLRAKTVQRALLKAGYPAGRVWSTKAICLWAREHGYVPAVPDVEGQQPLPPSPPHTGSSLSENTVVAEWMIANLASYTDGRHKDDIAEVDVISVAPAGLRIKVKTEPGCASEHVETMEMSHELQLQCCHVAESARQLGVRFEPEPIVPGISYAAAERVMLEALKSFTEDLLRRSLAQAWERNLYRAPASITPGDIKAAILDRQEFDILTNSGIGVQPMDTG